MVFYPCYDYFMNLMHDNSPQALALVYGSNKYPDLKGTVRFYQTPYEGILIAAEFYHLPSENTDSSSFYGFHIHENGDCSDDFAKTGSHYNPLNQPHPKHAGDMPPLLSCNGYSFMTFYAEQLMISQVIGKSVIVHEKPDDFTTQPSGNAGNKIACGVIRPF